MAHSYVLSRMCHVCRATRSVDLKFSFRISLAPKSEVSVVLNASDTLKLIFQVVEKDEGKGVQPHQTFLRFFDEDSGEEGIQPVKTTSAGKAKFELVRCNCHLSHMHGSKVYARFARTEHGSSAFFPPTQR